MGIGHSTTAEETKSLSSNKKYKQLYEDLRAKEGSKESATDEEFRARFIHYFGGPCPHLGELLYRRLFGGAGTLNEETFISSMSEFHRLSSSDKNLHEAEKFYFYVFSQGKETLNKEGLKEVIRIACMIALVVGSELHETALVPRDSPVIESMATSAMLVADAKTHELSAVQFAVWLKEHCPRLLEGVNHWIETLHSQHEDMSDNPAFHTSYHLPTPKFDDSATRDQINATYVLIWALSTITPLVYMGHKRDESAIASANKHPAGGVWTKLYSSVANGISMNRLQSHCFDYREPSLMLITTEDVEGKENQFVVGVDREWRDGTSFWGGEDCFLLELKPSFSLLKTGPKLISLNEKQRGFPTGLRFMTDHSHKSHILLVEASLERVERNGLSMKIIEIEVWGCGGEEAVDSQKRVKEWETKEIMRRRKINRDELKEAWEESPDRYLLELGGVRVTHPKEQQQE